MTDGQINTSHGQTPINKVRKHKPWTTVIKKRVVLNTSVMLFDATDVSCRGQKWKDFLIATVFKTMLSVCSYHLRHTHWFIWSYSRTFNTRGRCTDHWTCGALYLKCEMFREYLQLWYQHMVSWGIQSLSVKSCTIGIFGGSATVTKCVSPPVMCNNGLTCFWKGY